MLAPRLPLLLLALLPLACGDDGTAATDGSSGSGGSSTTTAGSTTTGEPPDPTTTSGESTTTVTSGSSSSSGSTGDPLTTGSTTDDTTTGPPPDLIECMNGIAGLTYEEQGSEIPDYRYFRLQFEQPIDHTDPGGDQFTQRLVLYHRDSTAPLVLVTEGYYLYNYQGLSEPADLLHANQINVEHRMFAESAYVDADWSTLTIEQAAGDHHRIIDALGDCFTGPRIATGVSKGGMTASYFRRFYPDDVDVTIPYVAPLSYGKTDQRYVEFVDNVGDPACRAALADAQRELLLRRPDMITRMQAQAQQNGYTYDLLGEDFVLDIIALEMPFAFWQYFDASLCNDIPTQASSDKALWDFYDAINPARGAEDQRLLAFEPYYFQAAVQLGAPGIKEDNLADLLMFPGQDVPESYVFTPDGPPVFDPDAMPDVAAWVAAEGQRILFIYGENDPWSAGAYEANPGADVHVLVAPAGNHGSKIADLIPADRDFAYQKLEEWTGVQPLVHGLPAELPLRARLDLDP